MKSLLGCVGLIVAVFAAGALSAFILSVLWNWIVPEVFNGPTVTFWQAWGLMILVSIVSGAMRK